MYEELDPVYFRDCSIGDFETYLEGNCLAGVPGRACPGRSYTSWHSGQAAPEAASAKVAPRGRRRATRRLGFGCRGWSRRLPKECLFDPTVA